MYPEVQEHMEANYDPLLKLEETIEMLYKGMEIAFVINQTDKFKLVGLGFTVVDKQGVRRHRRDLSEQEKKIILGQHHISTF